MNRTTWSRHGAAILGTLIMCAPAVAQTAQVDPWKRVPTPPASCFNGDGFGERVNNAKLEIAADLDQQTKLNAQIRQRFDAMDGMEKAQRLQAFMMKNPQEAAKFMQAQQSAGSSANDNMTKSATDGETLQKELEAQQSAYNDAVDKAVTPFQAQLKVMIETKTKVSGEAGSSFISLADQNHYLALIQQANTAYEKVCATYFAPTGRFSGWLKNFKTQVIEPRIASAEASDAGLIMQMKIMDTGSAGYRSTASLEGVRDYLQELGRVYSFRKQKIVPLMDLVLLK